MKRLLPLFLFLSMASASAGSCMDLESCVKLSSSITGKEYLLPPKLNGKVNITKGIKLNKSNAEVITASLLNQNGYTRVPLQGNIYKVISSRDVRYNPTQEFDASKEEVPSVPKYDDYFMMKYKGIHPELTTNITRSIRPFMSRYGRIIDMKSTGMVIVQDTGTNLHRIYSIIKDADIKPTKQMLKDLRAAKKQYQKVSLAKAKAQSCNKSK